MHWNNFVPSKRNRNGVRFYSKGFSQWIPCNSIIRCLAMPVNLNWDGKYYKLKKDLNKHIEENGDISY